ncbi:MAG: hypothetical protein A2931_01270 [Candidatus Niyogibacteria bacterium RIFCSPLOWO2_01_FULL_45_48]|uniref:Uncharacterized protein n=2 Tax=Candidatus Niyogiibacteriota TaxID=1817912 RepID=A0A1G2EYI4_9BACT|nr:MAG: hypothetical protein A2835_01500 [Candidatus Niyogibacteria bacterium RIFCSPHIGHO2_01_FULL_45_28]OGZ29683.1 MAG: hypothetical protein A2931_01270 [Candidatus Niyogibacteria bacterium RIFCSPLOWO2_01_FULL_45_48]OGZ30450.1 MAG: hypothetical protein A3J00_04240 [Candidatus Niyogibacteria bacterium RIFCSPLOWO2_02_FULL_45_13]
MHNRVGGVFAGALFALCGLGIVGAIQLAVQKASETGQIIHNYGPLTVIFYVGILAIVFGVGLIWRSSRQ